MGGVNESNLTLITHNEVALVQGTKPPITPQAPQENKKTAANFLGDKNPLIINCSLQTFYIKLLDYTLVTSENT